MHTTINPKCDTRKKILRATLTVAAERGFMSTTTDQIARKARVSEGIIYHYFKSKNELCIALISEHSDEFRKQLKVCLQACPTASEKLQKLIDFHFQYFTQEGSIFQVMFGKSGDSKAMMLQIFKAAIQPYAEIVSEIITQGIQSREFKDIDSEVAASSLLGMMQNNLLRIHFGVGTGSIDDTKTIVKRIFFEGVLL
jgi:TetR/AcrR family transcriptional regulator, fatty acid metabolism regulator protein